MKNPTESKEQRFVINKLINEGFLAFSIPNDGEDPKVAARHKAEGMLPGVNDFVVCLEGGITIWVEMKNRKGGYVRKKQKLFHNHMKSIAHNIIVAKGAKDAYDQFHAMRESLGLEMPSDPWPTKELVLRLRN